MDRLPQKLVLSTGAVTVGVAVGLWLNILRGELAPLVLQPSTAVSLGLGALVAAVLAGWD